jgi:hypothetical protein
VSTAIALSLVAKVCADADCTACTNNLRQLGIAFANYEETYHRFPPATIPNAALPPERRLSWVVETMPFVEQLGLLIDRTKAWDAEENYEPKWIGIGESTPEILGELKVMLCPANPDHGSGGMPSWTHYVGMAGIGPEAADRPVYDPLIGVFGYDRQTRSEDLRQRSTTLVILETATDNGPWTAGGPATLRGLEPGKPPYLGPDGQFSSLHRPHVTHAVFADGAVRALAASMSPSALEALATVTGGEVVADDF